MRTTLAALGLSLAAAAACAAPVPAGTMLSPDLADILRRARLVQHHRVSRQQLSVREQMSHLLKSLQGRRFVEFQELFEPERGVQVVVVTLIALLELSREHLVELTQAEAYAPMYVRLAYTPT